jgi:hypothetical protein
MERWQLVIKVNDINYILDDVYCEPNGVESGSGSLPMTYLFLKEGVVGLEKYIDIEVNSWKQPSKEEFHDLILNFEKQNKCVKIVNNKLTIDEENDLLSLIPDRFIK